MVALIIPALNGGRIFKECVAAIQTQVIQPDRLILMDSCSTDDTVQFAADAGFEVFNVTKGTFDHGGTRAEAIDLVQDDIVIFLTQDAVLDSSNSIELLLEAFDNPKTSAAYGRQLPNTDANPLASFTRLHNYGTKSYVTSILDDFPIGIRKAFLSNSFSAYRRSALIEVGNFESKLIMGEDTVAAGKMLLAGGNIAYVSEATVRHSHNYSTMEEFHRYFDIGVLHSSQSWMLSKFGKSEGEGMRFAIAQLNTLFLEKNYKFLVKSLMASAAKFIGYKLGVFHYLLGDSVSGRLAMHKDYFRKLK